MSEEKISHALASGVESKRKDRTGHDEIDEEEGSKRRKFNAGVTDDEMGMYLEILPEHHAHVDTERYKRNRIAREDPMANYRDDGAVY